MPTIKLNLTPDQRAALRSADASAKRKRADASGRSVRFDMRMTPSEAEALRQDAADAGLSQSEYVRSLIAKKRIRKPAPVQLNIDKAELADAVRALKYTSSNLNQLMHYANSGKYIDPADVEKTIKTNQAAAIKIGRLIDEAR